MPTTIKDIAKKLKLSEATVSRALSGKSIVNEDTRQRVILTAREMDYYSDKPTSVLSDKSKTIGLVLPEIHSNYYSQLISEIEGRLREKGFSIILGLTNFEDEIALHYLRLFANKKVDGIICEVNTTQEILNTLRLLKDRYRIPTMLIGESFDDMYEDFDTIEINEEYGITLAYNHLLSLGHKNIVMVGDAKSNSRCKIFESCCKAQGIEDPKKYIHTGEERFELGGYLRMKEFLVQKERPTAVIATYDACALGAMRAIHEAGLEVPRDISVIGVDNGRELPYYTPQLTSVKRIAEGLGESVTQMLVGIIRDSQSHMAFHLKIRPELVIRESTCPVVSPVNQK